MERIERWAASGLEADAFAAKEGINASTLQNWKWRLGAEKKRNRVGRPAATFVEVSAPASRDEAAPFEVSLRNGTRITVPAHFDTAAFREVVAALGGR